MSGRIASVESAQHCSGTVAEHLAPGLDRNITAPRDDVKRELARDVTR
jgi:hypothetical protein